MSIPLHPIPEVMRTYVFSYHVLQQAHKMSEWQEGGILPSMFHPQNNWKYFVKITCCWLHLILNREESLQYVIGCEVLTNESYGGLKHKLYKMNCNTQE